MPPYWSVSAWSLELAADTCRPAHATRQTPTTASDSNRAHGMSSRYRSCSLRAGAPCDDRSVQRSLSVARSLSATLVLVVVLLGALRAAPATAHADPIDDEFLAAINSRHIQYPSPQAALNAAREVCVELVAGKKTSDVVGDVMKNSSLDGYHAGYFVGASISAYCPSFASST